MPGIELLDYVRGDHITAEVREQIIEIVHDTIDYMTGKKPAHSNFRYSPAAYLDTSGYDYILVVERLTLRSTKLRSLSGEVIWIHNQKIDAVHVTPNGVRTMAVDVLVNNKERGEKLVKGAIEKLPTGPMTVAGKLKIIEVAQWSDELWMITVQGKTVPGREWLIDRYFSSTLEKDNSKMLKKNRPLAAEPLVRYADPDTERKFRRAVRVQQNK